MNRHCDPDFAEFSEISRKTTGGYIFGNTTADNACEEAMSVFCRCGINSGWTNGNINDEKLCFNVILI